MTFIAANGCALPCERWGSREISDYVHSKSAPVGASSPLVSPQPGEGPARGPGANSEGGT